MMADLWGGASGEMARAIERLAMGEFAAGEFAVCEFAMIVLAGGGILGGAGVVAAGGSGLAESGTVVGTAVETLGGFRMGAVFCRGVASLVEGGTGAESAT